MITRLASLTIANFALAILAAFGLGGSLAVAQTETVIHSFQSSGGADGKDPVAGVIADPRGALYGAASEGGRYGFGVVYKLAPPTSQGGVWKQNILYSFTGGYDGSNPSGSLLLNSRSGKLYGSTQYGGAHSSGVIYELSPPTEHGGSWIETVVYSFTAGADGGVPSSGVISDAKGALYGTTVTGGTHQSGTVFRLSLGSGGVWKEKVMYSFDQINGDLAYPSGLMLGVTGALYGTTGSGTAFELSPPSGQGPWVESNIHTFGGLNGDGVTPSSSLLADNTGALYGTTVQGGQYSNGTVYQLTPPQAPGVVWTEAVLYSFLPAGSGDGATPLDSLIFDSSGSLYGTTEFGGQSGLGTAFKLSPPTEQGGQWSEQVLHQFGGPGDGSYPYAPLLLLGTNFYGTTAQGGLGRCSTFGSPGCGTVFEISW
jgi:uncharacterized repeat protein (TIGR03803 family)